MQKLMKVLLGLITLWPFAYLVLFFVVNIATISAPGSLDQPGLPPLIAFILPLHIITMLVVMALITFYIVNVFRNERVDKDKKALWAIVLFLGNMIAMPIYWYMYVWKSAPVGAPRDPEQLNSADSSAWCDDVTEKRTEEAYVPPRQPPNWRE